MRLTCVTQGAIFYYLFTSKYSPHQSPKSIEHDFYKYLRYDF